MARGHSADLYDLGGGVAIRRYRDGTSAEDEARVMAHARELGYPAPAVLSARGPDLVLELVRGPTLRQAMRDRPWAARAHGRLLASLLDRLHALPAPSWVPERFGPGDRLLHLDLQPANVILAPAGPVVIDWRLASRGDPAADLAHTWLLVASLPRRGGPLRRAAVSAHRRVLLGALLGSSGSGQRMRARLAEVANWELAVLDLSERRRRRLLAALRDAPGGPVET